MAYQLAENAGGVSALKHFLPDLRDHHVLVCTSPVLERVRRDGVRMHNQYKKLDDE